ncbi:MAG: hypothetical protein RLZZ210_1651 [Pseudomonadota bacterium]|jgi:hypothetical protein
MKRIIIICEGQTEQEFCKSILQNYLEKFNIYLEAQLIWHSKGGIVPWKDLEPQIKHSLRDESCFVTTFIDYYKFPKKKFLNTEDAHKNSDKYQILNLLQDKMKDEVCSDRFIPYIQLHEFESLLFHSKEYFSIIPRNRINDIKYLTKTLNTYPDNCELINCGDDTAPSKRLKNKIIKGYVKDIDGIAIAKQIGLQNIFTKNPRFKNWIELIVNIAK